MFKKNSRVSNQLLMFCVHQKRPGSFGHELHDAATYCEWGVDYVKVICTTELILCKAVKDRIDSPHT